MTHITQDQAMAIVKSTVTKAEYDDLTIQSMLCICNAAIAHYIEQSVSELTGTDYKMPAAQEPVAYFDFQEKGFRWANHMSIGKVPVAVRVEAMPLYAKSDLASGAAPKGEQA